MPQIKFLDYLGQFLISPQQLTDATSDMRALILGVRDELKGLIVTSADRLSAALDGIQGDIDTLKAAAAAQQAALDAALADQSAAVAEAVTTAVAAAKADFDASLDALASRAESIDAETAAPEPTPEPAAAQADDGATVA